MPEEKQIPFWPSWNTEYGRDFDPADYEQPKKVNELYEDQRRWEKERLKTKKS